MQLMESQQSERALEIIKETLPFANDDQKFAIAEFYIQWGFYEESVAILKELLRKHPEESELKIILANIYVELDDDKAAINLLNGIGKDDPSYVQSLVQLADLYQSQGLFEVAEQKLLEAKKINPHEQIIDFALGEFFFSIGQYTRAILYYEKIYTHTETMANISIVARLAESLASSGEYEKALQFFQQLKTDDPDILFKYGFTAYHADSKDIAINVWKQVLEYDEYYHSVYYELAKAYQEEGNLQEAYKTSQKGLQLDHFNKELFYLGGKLAYQLQKLEESEELIDRAIELDSDYMEAILFLIELYKEQDKFDKIIELMNNIKEQGSTDPIYEWELARAYNEIESYQEAFKHYKKTYSYLNDNSEFLKEYGYFLTEDGKVDEAIPVFEKYLQHVPTDHDIHEYVERLKQSTMS